MYVIFFKVQICRKSCKQMCSHFTPDMRKDLFKFFYSHSYDEQSAFLTKCIRMEEPKRRRAGKTDATSLKLCSFTYFINDKKVCKTTFLDVFKITHRRIQTLQDKLKLGVHIPTGQRGKHHNIHRI